MYFPAPFADFLSPLSFQDNGIVRGVFASSAIDHSSILRCPIKSSQEIEVPRTGLAAIGDKLEADLLAHFRTIAPGRTIHRPTQAKL